MTDAATVVLGFGAYAKLTFLGNFFVCLSPNFGLVMGCMMIGRFENGETGMKRVYEKSYEGCKCKCTYI